jgi:pimeloyl-ACP methyl ester carboxylesterase
VPEPQARRIQARRIPLATGLSYSVLEWTADEAALDHPVILIHGFLDNAWGWYHAVQAGLEGRYHLVCPDMRGHGDSDRVGPGGYYYFFDYVADLAGLIDELGADKVSLVGHSMGGSVASYFAGTFPERVHRLALLEGLGPPQGAAKAPDKVKIWIASWRRAVMKEPRTYASVSEAAARLRKNDTFLTEERALFLAEHGTRAVTGGFQFKHDPLHLTLGPYPYRTAIAAEFWRRIQCPVLLVDGEKSSFAARSDEYQDRIACFDSPELAVIPDAGHMLMRHNPEAVAKVLSNFLCP